MLDPTVPQCVSLSVRFTSSQFPALLLLFFLYICVVCLTYVCMRVFMYLCAHLCVCVCVCIFESEAKLRQNNTKYSLPLQMYYAKFDK